MSKAQVIFADLLRISGTETVNDRNIHMFHVGVRRRMNFEILSQN